ncbi:MAG TPA: NAD(P)H-binding protein [Puia sp.]|nr:NAD(P)H-binding protein [Puia sp.]
MKIVVTGSLGHISKPLAQELIQKGHAVTVVTSKAERKGEIEGLGAIAAVGKAQDADFLTTTFAGADLVYTMIPPGNIADPNFDIYAEVRTLAESYRKALAAAGTKRVIHLSSIGAHTDKGNGLLKLHYLAETTLKQLPADVHLTFMRPTGFYYNLLAYIPMIKQQGLIAANYGQDDWCIWVAPVDIATAIVEEIEKPAKDSPFIRYVASDELTCSETAHILGQAIGKPDLQWIKIPNQQMLDALIARGMPRDFAEGMVEMYANRNMYEDYFNHRPVPGKTRVTQFAKDFAAVYQQQ